MSKRHPTAVCSGCGDALTLCMASRGSVCAACNKANRIKAPSTPREYACLSCGGRFTEGARRRGGPAPSRCDDCRRVHERTREAARRTATSPEALESERARRRDKYRRQYPRLGQCLDCSDPYEQVMASMVRCRGCQAEHDRRLRSARWRAKQVSAPACSVEGCDAAAGGALGLCTSHYKRRRRAEGGA